jgi:hypothetical protein
MGKRKYNLTLITLILQTLVFFCFVIAHIILKQDLPAGTFPIISTMYTATLGFFVAGNYGEHREKRLIKEKESE